MRASPRDTIAAIATPPGRGGVGVVRLSGRGAEEVLARVAPAWPSGHASHMMRLCDLRDARGELLDEALVVIMRGPRSYTGEDVAELQCHGGPIILRRVLDATIEAGARVAEPGEFTQRAFLNGRLDLTQAEAVADLIHATSEQAHRQALEHLQGSLGARVRAMRELLAQCTVLIESAIDFSHEEHVYQIERDEVGGRLEQVGREVDALLASFDQGRRRREGVRAALIGATNAGKSTLFNALLEEERAIVTDVAGTTRDFLEEQLVLEGALVRLVDTAGLRETDDLVESIGIERSRAQRDAADLVVCVLDSTRPLTGDEREALDALRADPRPVLIAWTKRDLPLGVAEGDRAMLERSGEVLECAAPEGRVGELREALARVARELTEGEGALLSRARHREHVAEAAAATARARASLAQEMPHEIVALDVREALDALGGIVGHVTPDDILNRIFSEFCVGK